MTSSTLPPTDFLHQLADVADCQTMARYRTEHKVDEKIKAGERFDPVTEADREAETEMRRLITSVYPDCHSRRRIRRLWREQSALGARSDRRNETVHLWYSRMGNADRPNARWSGRDRSNESTFYGGAILG